MDIFRRQTALDVVDNKLKSLNTKSLVLRTIFAGKHNFASAESVHMIHSTHIQKINSGHCDVPVTGILLLYKKHFFVISEGSECTTMRQIDLFLNNDDLIPNVHDLKILAVYHNVNKLIFNTWKTIYGEPLELISTLEGELSESKITEILKSCLEKLLYMCTNLKENIESDIEFKLKAFPEIIKTNVLLASSFIMNLQKYFDMYLKLNEYSYSFENCWPAPYDFTPCLEIEKSSNNTFIELLSDIDDFIITEKSEEIISESINDI